MNNVEQEQTKSVCYKALVITQAERACHHVLSIICLTSLLHDALTRVRSPWSGWRNVY